MTDLCSLWVVPGGTPHWHLPRQSELGVTRTVLEQWSREYTFLEGVKKIMHAYDDYTHMTARRAASKDARNIGGAQLPGPVQFGHAPDGGGPLHAPDMAPKHAH